MVAAGALWLDDRLHLEKLDLVGSGIDERPRLVALAELLHDRPTLVTYNGRGFDLPVLRLRCLRHAVVAPELFVDDDHGMGDGRGGRPLEHIDLHQTLGSSGRGPGLDAVARLSGLPGKLLGDGSQVEGWWRAGEVERIESYCLSDVVQTALVFLRVQRIAGRLEAEAYRASVLGLLEALALLATTEKDPLTLMDAACTAGPGIVVTHIGAALDAALGAAAERTMAACPNYRWLGALPHGAARRRIATAAALVHPSRLEGGANVVIEAVRSGVPVLASRIDGNSGLLGADYDGYFPAGDSVALAALMRRFQAEPAFAARLRAQCAAREPLFRPAAERAAVKSLLADLVGRAALGRKTIAR